MKRQNAAMAEKKIMQWSGLGSPRCLKSCLNCFCHLCWAKTTVLIIKGYDSIKALATKVWFTRDMLYVLLQDGREVGVPLLWFPWLRRATDEQLSSWRPFQLWHNRKYLGATDEQLSSWRLIGDGTGIHRDDIDEDISVAALL